jgi:nucleoside-diphosphate-sugar epimerase
MSRILVTGAAGFAGRYACRELVGRGHDVIGTVFRGGRTNSEASKLYEIDIRDTGAVHKLVREVQPERVLHLAAMASPANGDKLAFYEVNTLATIGLLEALRKGASSLCKVLLVSSANVYGEPGVEVLSEDMRPAPINIYGTSKLSMEHLAEGYRNDFALQIIRPFNFTGRGQTKHFLVPKIVAHFRERAHTIELGNTQVSRDFSDVRDTVQDFADLLEADDITQLMNVCSGDFLKLQEILFMCEVITGHTLDVRVNPGFVRPNDILRLRGSRERLDAALGPRPRRSFEETLRWMLQAD